MDRMQTTVDTCSTTATTGSGASATPCGAAGGTAQVGDADPEIAIAIRGKRPGPVALYWHGVPSPAAASAVLALARALGPVRVQRVIEPDGPTAVGADHRLPRALARAGTEVVLCQGADRPRVLANAWHDVVVDDLARHPGVATVVLAGAPAAVAARVVPAVRSARRQCVRLRQHVGAAAVAMSKPATAIAVAA